MKFLDKMILCIFSVLILLMAVISSACIFGWVDATGLYVFVTKALADQTTCNILLGLNVVLILFAIKGIFFESNEKEENFRDGILLENEDGKLLITKDTLTSMVNSVVSSFEGVESQQSKIILDSNNDVSIILTLEVSNNAVIKELSNNIQVKVKDAIKKSLDVDIKNLDIRVKNVIKPEENKAN